MPREIKKQEPQDGQVAKTLEDLSVVELKALVYDRIGVIEQLQFRMKSEQDEIAKINSVIQKKQQK